MIDELEQAASGMRGSGKEPEAVAKVYLCALTDTNPKPFYSVGAGPKSMRVLSRIAPQRSLDAMGSAGDDQGQVMINRIRRRPARRGSGTASPGHCQLEVVWMFC